MEIQIDRTTPGLRRVRLAGRLDTDGAAAIEVRFNAATSAAAENAIVDLSQVTFIASMGIGILIGAARALRDREHAMVVVARDLVAEALRSTGFDEIVPIVDSLDDALVRLAAS